MLESNPQGKEINKLIQESNGDYEMAFRNKAKEFGINPDDFINSFK